MWSERSNPSVSSYNSSTREMHRRTIASAFFGPISTTIEAVELIDEEPESQRSTRTAFDSALTTDEVEGGQEQKQKRKRKVRTQLAVPFDPPGRENEMLEQRDRRRENRSLFEDLVHLANTHQPVQFDRFKQRRSHGKSLSAQLRQSGSANAYDVGVSSSSGDEEEEAGDELNDETINTELLEAYIAYSKSIGNEPNIQLNPVMILHRPRGSHVDNDDEAEEYEQEQHHTIKLSYIYDRPVLKEREKLWTGMMGTRFSKHRGCVQFWTWLLIGVGVLLWLGISLSSLQLNEVLHLDAFTVQDVQVTGDYTFLHFLEEVDSISRTPLRRQLLTL
ncbi:unnamed protein product [Peronospora destructor]|uniref:Uncharacterized protein n=1 Tax=Peronospora destructor TaxID=86335 RepID=A0AAV0TZY0_9STRA|nr:unnamed protein product [Peronospora destructor]